MHPKFGAFICSLLSAFIFAVPLRAVAIGDCPFASAPQPHAALPFWSYDAKRVTAPERILFEHWLSAAKFKDYSPTIASATFRKGPISQTIFIDGDGRLAFKRNQHDGDPHTMLELGVPAGPSRHQFVNYDGYRSMKIGIPFAVDLEVAVSGDHWWEAIDWLVVFQGHAMPGVPNIGAKYNPPFALVVTRGRWQLHIRADSRPRLPRDRKYMRFSKIDLGEVVRDRTEHFSFCVVWGYADGPSDKAGSLTIYKNGAPMYSETQRMNFYNNKNLIGESLGPYVTFGAYTPLMPKQSEDILVFYSRIAIY